MCYCIWNACNSNHIHTQNYSESIKNVTELFLKMGFTHKFFFHSIESIEYVTTTIRQTQWNIIIKITVSLHEINKKEQIADKNDSEKDSTVKKNVLKLNESHFFL